MSDKNIIVFDEEYAYAAKEILDYGNALISYIDKYTKLVNRILEKAIIDVEISLRVLGIVNRVEALKSVLETISKEASSLCKSYVEEIDNADKYLY